VAILRSPGGGVVVDRDMPIRSLDERARLHEARNPMTITNDPHHPQYLDESDVRNEMTRVASVCHGCQQCVDLCPSFPTLFEMIDRHDDHDAGRLTPAEQDRVVDECFHCKLCAVNCPYGPGRHEAPIDFPQLMLRAVAMRRATGQTGARDRATTTVLGHADLVGAIACRLPDAANRVVGARPGSPIRRVLDTMLGVSSRRVVPLFARQRFSTWFDRRPKVRIEQRQARIALFPTCLVEYQQPAIGHDLVKVYEHNGVEVSLADIACCGAPWLFNGDLARFQKAAKCNITALAAEVAKGRDIVVPQPTCAYVLKHDYPLHAPGAEADTVSAHTYDASEYLLKVHRADGTSLDMEFDGDVPTTITYHAPSHLRAQGIGLRSRDLMKLTGARVTLVQASSGVDAMWGWRSENAARSLPVGVALGAAIIGAGGEVVAGDCHLANTVINEQTGRTPLHPIQVVARAYGIAEEEQPR
jgi:glycerol-3-phosphate dehydrogenase subunit C